MARLDIDNDFCAASGTTPCTLQFNEDLSVAHLHVDRDLIMDKSGHTIFDVNIGVLDRDRVSLTKLETLHGTYDFEDMTLGDSGFNGDIVYTYGGSSKSLYGYKVFIIIIFCHVIGKLLQYFLCLFLLNLIHFLGQIPAQETRWGSNNDKISQICRAQSSHSYNRLVSIGKLVLVQIKACLCTMYLLRS